ncbi:MAG TPA: sigma 54-interacting transcriptional regulator [Tepidimicrobium sp.]|nr:sigma 54-interacting transcriptional regulator [Tepidimicrobium sp.]
MKDRLKQLIDREDKKNPYTDIELSEMLDLRRDSVTVLRNELDIPNSRERLKPYLIGEIRRIIAEDPDIPNRQLTELLKERGFMVSRYLVSQLAGEVKAGLKDMAVMEKDNEIFRDEHSKNLENGNDTELSSFKDIIGFDGSLKPQIHQAKAAILYPPHGLHTLILGPTGVGKSKLAEAMYNYAIESGSIAAKAPFVVFNCADYAENPQLLLSQLFGYVKGAFTGADTSKEGLVEKAEGGILFLDEIHRLPPEGQELFYFLIDKGKFRRMGETDTERTANVMLIAATTEDIESSLLLTFRRRIPMVIELSSLAARPYDERNQIIRNFFNEEADRIGLEIRVTRESLRALLVYDCPGNIGQLRSDIQVACARGFLTYVSRQEGYIEVDLSDLPAHVRRGLLKIEKRNPEMEFYYREDFIARPGKMDAKEDSKRDLYALPIEIYQYIEDRYQQLESKGLEAENINRVISGELDERLMDFIGKIEVSHQHIAKQDLVGIVGQEIVSITEEITGIGERRLGRIDKHLFCCLAMHLSATLERIRLGKPIANPYLHNVMNKYKLEYSVAEEMVKHIEQSLEIDIPKDEIGFIAMYLRTITNPASRQRRRVGVVVLTHGHVALGMVEVANRLLGVNHAVGIEMALDERPKIALERAIEAVKEIDEGKGVLILVDMGSLITFGEIITKKTGIPTRTVDRVNTVMVLEAVRKAMLPDADLDKIAEGIDNSMVGIGRGVALQSANSDKKAIITLCITGEGSAIRLKNLLTRVLPEVQEKAEIIPMRLIGGEDISIRIGQIKKDRELAAIVGTVDPGDDSIPFISLEEVIDGRAFNKLQNILNLELKTEVKHKEISAKPLSKLIHEELIVIDPDYKSKDEVIDGLTNMLMDGGFVNEGFLLDVYRREAMGSTLIKGIVAIPHGAPENIKRSAVSICILREPIPWWAENEAEIVFLLALKEDAKQNMMDLYRIIEDIEFLHKLKGFNDAAYVRNAIIEKSLE